MQHYYDGQIRRYIVQTIRALSNFVVKYGDGTLHQVPIMYGDPDRQVATILRGNSENKLNSVPRMSVYVTGLDLDRDRLADQTFIGKVHIRERDTQIDPDTGRETYNQSQGKNYTVERLMPTPYKLTLKCDIWSANTDQKLQILEQILVLFNPSLELQTTSNYIDWTSITVLEMDSITWSSRQVPVGVDSPIDIASLTLKTPVWISPPVKVKHLGVITKIISSIYNSASTSDVGYIDGLGADDAGSGTTSLSEVLSAVTTTISGFQIQVYADPTSGLQERGIAVLLNPNESVVPREPAIDVSIRQGTPVNWDELFNHYPGKYIAGSSRVFLTQASGNIVVGTIAIDPIDYTRLRINWDTSTLQVNSLITTGNRTNSPGTFDAIINPQTFNPKRPNKEQTDQPITAGARYLLVDDIGNIDNEDGADAWKSNNGVDLIAVANDIVEWDGAQWNVIFDSTDQNRDELVWQTNIYTGVQYVWDNVSWSKSFEGEYGKGQWRIEL